MSDVLIVGACRTPIGGFAGSLSSLAAPRLGAIAIQEALKRSGIGADHVDEVIMGNVISAGIGQAPARQAALFAGLPPKVECMTVNKVCGSGLKAVMLGTQAILLGDAGVVVAGGMESMSNAPYLLQDVRRGLRIGNAAVVDSMMKDGLIDAYDEVSMGSIAELCAKECHIPRDAQDAFAIQSYSRAQKAQKEGRFEKEIVPVSIPGRKGEMNTVSQDEDPSKTDFRKIPALKPAFQKDGTVTAANASNISDGAAALVLTTSTRAKELGTQPMARIVSYASFAKDPKWFTTAPSDVIPKVLKKSGLKVSDIDLFEVNEAFAVVALAVNKIAGLDPERVNVNGGAIALGHPLGASGARILVTLLYALEQQKLRRGLAAICIGGGEASAVIVERIAG